MRRLLLPLLLVASVASAADPTPPTVAWKRGRLLQIVVTPPPATHLSADLGVRAVLDDGNGYRIEWNEPDPAQHGATTLQLPVVATKGSTGWTLEVSGGVCNDDESLCLPFVATVELHRRGPRRGEVVATAGRPKPTAPPLPKTPVQPPRPEGLRWYAATTPGDVQRAWQAAAKTERPVLIDAFATWCPPCDRLRDEFLEDPARAGLLSEFVLLKIDADHPSSFELKERYAVGGYPTVLLVAPDGSLIDRIVGYGGPEVMAGRLRGALGSTTTDALAKEASQPGEVGDAATVAWARRLIAEGDPGAAWAALIARFDDLAAALAGDWEALEAVVWALPEDPGVDVAGLAEATLAAAPTPGVAAAVASRYGRLLPEAARPAWTARWTGVVDAAIADAGGVELSPGRGDEQLLGSVPPLPSAVLEDLSVALYYRGAAAKDGTSFFAQAALLLGAVAIAETPGQRLKEVEGRRWAVLPQGLTEPVLRAHEGRIHDLLSALKRAQLPDVAPPIYAGMLKLHGETFTWPYRHAGYLRDRGQLEAAEAAARTARAFGYGDNRLRAAGRLAEILAAQGRRGEAMDVLRDALGAEAPTEAVRTHRYRKALQEQLDSLEER